MHNLNRIRDMWLGPSLRWLARSPCVLPHPDSSPRAAVLRLASTVLASHRLRQVPRRSTIVRALFPHRFIWPEATLAKGVAVAAQLGCQPNCDRVLVRYYSALCGEALRPPYTVNDYCMHGETLLYLGRVTGRDEFAVIACAMFEHLAQQFTQPYGIPYRCPDRGYFVDTLGIVCPFIAAYASATGRADAADMVTQMLLGFMAQAIDGPSRLPWQVIVAGQPPRLQGRPGWGRGAGWLMLGLADSFAHLRPYPDHSARLRPHLSEFADGLASYQRSDGGWGSRVDDPESPYDSSATSLIAYGMARAMTAGAIAPAASRGLEAAVASLVAHTDSSGTVGSAEGVCRGPGLYATSFGRSSYAQGMALAAAAVLAHWGSPT